jgi:plasmid stabilization system protein ParE
MSRSILIHEAAEAEINEAADFYDMECPGLGTTFINEIERAIKKISAFPESAPIIREPVRKRTIVKFPYSLIYTVRADEIRILAVAHQKRRPFYWRGRR